MANWFDPRSPAAPPGAFGPNGVLFAGAYVALQVGRNLAAASLLTRDQPLRDIFERLVCRSAVSGGLWLAGAALGDDQLIGHPDRSLHGVSALALSAAVTALLSALALWELRANELRPRQHRQEGATR